MKKKTEDENTRYYLDLDLKRRVVLNWDYDQRDGLSQELADPFHHRVFLTKGQYNKLQNKNLEL
jgi:hypothetical protein